MSETANRMLQLVTPHDPHNDKIQEKLTRSAELQPEESGGVSREHYFGIHSIFSTEVIFPVAVCMVQSFFSRQ